MSFGAILPDGAGSFITIWPTGSAQPTVSSINPIQGVVVANAAIVPAGTSGSISIFPNTSVDLYGDINGYFTDEYGNNNDFEVHVNSTQFTILASNASTSCSNSCGLDMTTAAGHAIVASANGTGVIYGAWGLLSNTSSDGAGESAARPRA